MTGQELISLWRRYPRIKCLYCRLLAYQVGGCVCLCMANPDEARCLHYEAKGEWQE